MTGGPRGGVHRGRAVDRAGGAHWWRGDGPGGGGTHAVGGPGPRLLTALLLVAVLATGILVVLTGRGDDRADAVPPAAASPATSAGSGTADASRLRASVDAVLASTPVRFAPAVATPLPGPGLASLADALRATPGVPVTVEGHTAPVGADGPRAQELSLRRADEVAGALVALGVDRARISTVGRGPADPRPTLDESRRVELRVG